MAKFVEVIETKLENGVQHFSASEVAMLLNHIRIQKKLLEVSK